MGRDSGNLGVVGWAKALAGAFPFSNAWRAPLPTIGIDASGTIGGGQRRRRDHAVKRGRASAFCPPYEAVPSLRRLRPDAALLHQRDLLVDHVALVVGVLGWDLLQVAVLRIDRLLIDDLCELGA